MADRQHRSERGAVLVHAALALLALMALTTFVIDYGVLWTARRQAQNAADAGALAGAVGLGLDNSTDRTNSGPAKGSAYAAAQAHFIWGQAAAVDINRDITFPPCPDDGTDSCIRVEVHRDTVGGNPLPMIFGQLVGLTQQGVRAVAIAKAGTANATECLKPWGVIDRWAEHYPVNPGTWTVNSVFDKYLATGSNAGTVDPAIPVPDEYIAPATGSPGTGFHPFIPGTSPPALSADYGFQMDLTVGAQTDFAFATGWFAPLALFDSTGGKDYKNNIKGCVGTVYKIGDDVEVATEPGLKVGPTEQAVEGDVDSIIARDPNAYWDPTLNSGHGGVANSAFPSSPRIVAVPLVNPDIMVQVQKGGRTTVPIANIMGFFVEDYDKSKKAVVGRLMTAPGMLVSSGPNAGGFGFLQAIYLIR